jgi:hypothetical protein
VCNCDLITFFEKKGRLGINVKRNRQVGGTDMIKLYEIAAAFSVRLGTSNLSKKYFNTSYNGIPWKPGRIHSLLLFFKSIKG